MSKDKQRKQRKMNKAVRTARRRAKAAAKIQAPQFDPSLPTTRAEIEAAQEAVLQEMAAEDPARVEHHEQGRKILMTSSQTKLMKLQLQLFRVVFGREPGPHDPVFWDRAREHEGVFRIDPAQHEHAMRKAVAITGIRPEIGYAMALTGLVLTAENEHLHSEEDLEEWQDAIDDYRHQAETGVLPLTPNEFMGAWTAINKAASYPNVIPLNFAAYANMTDDRTLNLIGASLQSELGSEEKALAAKHRIAALVALAESGMVEGLLSADGYSEKALFAAASAEIDRKTRRFHLDSFRNRLDALTNTLK
jgi:hypothetical protein